MGKNIHCLTNFSTFSSLHRSEPQNIEHILLLKSENTIQIVLFVTAADKQCTIAQTVAVFWYHLGRKNELLG